MILIRASQFVALVGTLVGIGWVVGFNPILSVGETVTMKPSTAMAFIMLGLSGWITRAARNKSDLRQFIAPLAAGMSLVTGAGLLGLLPAQAATVIHTQGPGIPSLGTMACFTLCAGKYLFALHGKRRLSTTCAALSISLAATAAVGYVTNRPALFYWVEGWSTGMAIHTAALFLVDGINTLRVARTASGDHSTQGNEQ